MKVDKKLIKGVAGVARLELTDEEIRQFEGDFKEILESFSKLDEVDVEGVKESFQPVEIKNRLREDLVEESLSQEDALSNTKNKKDGYFKGPRAI